MVTILSAQAKTAVSSNSDLAMASIPHPSLHSPSPSPGCLPCFNPPPHRSTDSEIPHRSLPSTLSSSLPPIHDAACEQPCRLANGHPNLEPAAEPLPQHLVIMVNGIFGSASNWKFAADQFKSILGSKVMVHCSARNASTLTFDGVDVMGHRLAEEVKAVIAQLPGVKKISFLAHSLGGLVARYAIGQLYFPAETDISSHGLHRNKSRRDTSGSERDDIDAGQSQGTIAGLEPINFITVATPHLGSRGHKQLPFLFGVSFLENVVAFTAHWLIGKTGRHLFLTDGDKSQLPLLRRMVTDCGEGQFLSALRAFKRRVAYANISYDHMVGWRTASIRRESELPELHNVSVNEKYPHVVRVEDAIDIIDNTRPALDLVEEEMIAGLRQVSWQRVDVKFHGSPQMLTAHSTIQVKYYWMHSEGADVIVHIIDNFAV